MTQDDDGGAPRGGEWQDGEAELSLPPGFRFHPTDEELVGDYLKAADTLAEVDMYRTTWWEPERGLRAWSGTSSRRDRSTNGSRFQAAGRHRKATGADSSSAHRQTVGQGVARLLPRQSGPVKADRSCT
ncbi:hypothetical protein ZWY2020_026700 [Hordeum vulgare]|nr:hypothetical protein ZWY2020_026700 [Hordeum vulgare]